MTRSWEGGGSLNLILSDIKERERSQMEIAETLSKEVRKETLARAFVQQQSTFGGRRGGMPIQYVLQAPTLDKLQEFLPTFMQKVNESPVFQMADVNLRFTKPEARIEIDRDKASLLGVSTRNIAQTLQYALSGQRMGYFYMNGKQYQILGGINPSALPIIPNLSFTFCISDLTIFTLLYDKITNSQADNKKLWQKNKK